MLTEQEQRRIRLISDYELYPQACAFLDRMGQPLSQTQINGLLNVSLASTYARFTQFVEKQQARKSWPNKERHIEMFYGSQLPALLTRLEQAYVPRVQASDRDVQAVKMALVREFLQHLLAENAYRTALLRASTNAQAQRWVSKQDLRAPQTTEGQGKRKPTSKGESKK